MTWANFTISSVYTICKAYISDLHLSPLQTHSSWKVKLFCASKKNKKSHEHLCLARSLAESIKRVLTCLTGQTESKHLISNAELESRQEISKRDLVIYFLWMRFIWFYVWSTCPFGVIFCKGLLWLAHWMANKQIKDECEQGSWLRVCFVSYTNAYFYLCQQFIHKYKKLHTKIVPTILYDSVKMW